MSALLEKNYHLMALRQHKVDGEIKYPGDHYRRRGDRDGLYLLTQKQAIEVGAPEYEPQKELIKKKKAENAEKARKAAEATKRGR